MEAVQKTHLTLHEFAKFMDRTYLTVYEWVKAGRVKAVERKTPGKTFYRVSVEEAQAVKNRVESGLWV